ncbi:MAG: hypothetical protein IJO85_06785 [Lachnospiraceae bacterium]|nr:hypothetical protein [Lachnospiraceae bacterium]
MYKRENLGKGKGQLKEIGYKRYRNQIMNFRVTVEEKQKIEKRMELSGLSKQDFFIQSLMNQQVICIGNIKSFTEINRQLLQIEEHLKNVTTLVELDENMMESLRMILELYVGIKRIN